MNRTSSNAPKGKPSMAHPPAPKRRSFYGEQSEAPQNEDRLTGPPMQMGAGKNSMFADGRRGQPQGARPMSPNMGAPGPGPMHARGQMQGNPPPSPNYPQASVGPNRVTGERQGIHPKGNPTAVMLANGRMPKGAHAPNMMMADGLDAPEMMGAEPDADDQQPPAAPEGGGAGAGPLPMIRPEAVDYIDHPQPCSQCAYMGQDGNCSVLQMMVSESGHCNAWEQGAGAGDEMENNGAPQSDIGTSDGGMGQPS